MARKKKNIKQKIAEFTYNKPSMDQRVLTMKKHFGEISSILNDKKDKKK